MHLPSHYVAFVDILGFAEQVENLAPNDFLAIREYWIQGLLPNDNSPAYRLVETYEAFQKMFSTYQGYAALDGGRRTPTSVVDAFLFSDSAFVATTNARDLISFCRSLLVALMVSGVPVRAGMGAGTFSSFDIETRRSTAGHAFVRCPFVGSAVVRAYRAESCGLRGLRCFVHPSFVESATPEVLDQLLVLEEHDRCSSASHEVDLLWSPIGACIGPDEIKLLVTSVETMKLASPPNKAQYYDNTVYAFRRMLQRHTLAEAG